MHRDHLVALLVTLVLGDVVQVITANGDGAVHLAHAGDLADEDAATDGNVAGEGALLVNVVVLDGIAGGLEAQANVLVEAGLTDGLLLGEGPLLLVEEDGLLLLVCFLVLNIHPCCP